ncbi:MAG: hypothetical protein GQ564_22650 [Bacteroidales bacterium]|nr:hypothetical protein [Bacteroidales bacterium]
MNIVRILFLYFISIFIISCENKPHEVYNAGINLPEAYDSIINLDNSFSSLEVFKPTTINELPLYKIVKSQFISSFHLLAQYKSKLIWNTLLLSNNND